MSESAIKFSPIEHFLKPFVPWLKDPAVSEIMINQPHVVWIEKNGVMQSYSVDNLSYHYLRYLTDLIASHSSQRISESEPLLSATLPNGARVQIVLPPIMPKGSIALSIRKHSIQTLSLDDYQQSGFFNDAKAFSIDSYSVPYVNDEDLELVNLLKQSQFGEFIKQAILKNKNIMISGATSTGKTTFLNACLALIPDYERILTIEDVREINLHHHNVLQMVTSKNNQGLANISMQDCVQASLRLRPDRIIMGELRGGECADFIAALSTGHEGSFSTIHANNPYVAFMRMINMVRLNPACQSMEKSDILDNLQSVIDIIVQIKRKKHELGMTRYVSDIWFKYVN